MSHVARSRVDHYCLRSAWSGTTNCANSHLAHERSPAFASFPDDSGRESYVGRRRFAGLGGAYVRFLDQNGDQLPAGSLTTIYVNTVTGDIDDIIYTEAS